MKSEIIKISDSANAFEAAETMMKHDVGSLLVLDSKKEPYALLTDEDLVRKVLAKRKLDSTVKQVASKPLIGIGPEADISEAARLMGKKKIKRLIVFENRKVVGIIAARDIVDISPSLYDLIAERERVR
ncbi:CBS domain-containing protein [Candidatus Micrarchaeota archaeon]|nr:CBS domain-containing protein [Candidatus Micrarchaeota archaeon]